MHSEEVYLLPSNRVRKCRQPNETYVLYFLNHLQEPYHMAVSRQKIFLLFI